MNSMMAIKISLNIEMLINWKWISMNFITKSIGVLVKSEKTSKETSLIFKWVSRLNELSFLTNFKEYGKCIRRTRPESFEYFGNLWCNAVCLILETIILISEGIQELS